jgi:hypothetical protein
MRTRPATKQVADQKKKESVGEEEPTPLGKEGTLRAEECATEEKRRNNEKRPKAPV